MLLEDHAHTGQCLFLPLLVLFERLLPVTSIAGFLCLVSQGRAVLLQTEFHELAILMLGHLMGTFCAVWLGRILDIIYLVRPSDGRPFLRERLTRHVDIAVIIRSQSISPIEPRKPLVHYIALLAGFQLSLTIYFG